MNVLVLGTSNSILKGGYIDGLRVAMPEATFINKSIGGSPGTQFARYCVEDLSGYDCVIFDSIVNDENQLWNIGSDDLLERVLHDIMSTIASQARLLVVGFCNERHFYSKSEQFSIHERCSHACKAKFYSIYDFFYERPEITPLFEAHGTHVVPYIAFEFGKHLAGVIRSLPVNFYKPASLAHKFLVNDASLYCDKYYQKRNSLTSERFGVLEGRGVSLQLNKYIDRINTNKFLTIGLFVDIANTNCTLDVGLADLSCTRSISLRYELDLDDLRIKFVPIRNGVVCDTLTISDSVGEPSPHENREANRNGYRASISKVLAWKHK